MTTQEALENMMKDNNQGLSIKKPENIDHFTDFTDVGREMMYLDKEMVRENFSGNTIAGEPVVYTVDKWGGLNISLQGYKLKRQTKRVLLDALREDHFKLQEERVLGSVWTLEKGLLFSKSDKPLAGAFLYRGNMAVGFYKEGTNVKRTIDWYEKAIYGSSIKVIHRTHRVKDFKPEVAHEVYDTQSPEFTKEVELEEIAEFIYSLKRRVLSGEEQDILTTIYSDIGFMVEDLIPQLSDEDLLQECLNRGI